MNDLKYVILIPKGMNANGARAIIFNGIFNHRTIVHAAVAVEGHRLYSAGFCNVRTRPNGGLEVKCFGQSESLKVSSKKGDEQILARTLSLQHGFYDMKAYGI